MAGARTDARFSDLGLLDFKGPPDPMPVCEVAWDPLPQCPVPLPSLMTGSGRVFVGSGTEVAWLQAEWRMAAGGDRRCWTRAIWQEAC